MSNPTAIKKEIGEVLGVKSKVGQTKNAYNAAVVAAYNGANDATLDKLSEDAESFVKGLLDTVEAESAGNGKGADFNKKDAKTSAGKPAAKKAAKGKKAAKVAKPKAAAKSKSNGKAKADKPKRGPSFEDTIRAVVFSNPLIDGEKLVEKVRAKGCDASERTIGTQAATFRGALRFLKREGVKLGVELEA